MAAQTIYRLHRVTVDWVVDTFHLPTDTAQFHAEARARARTFAYALNRRERRHHERHPHPRREPRVLVRWQQMIGNAVGRGERVQP
jgi:hypothetical protein